jgi:hypothetical protein
VSQEDVFGQHWWLPTFVSGLRLLLAGTARARGRGLPKARAGAGSAGPGAAQRRRLFETRPGSASRGHGSVAQRARLASRAPRHARPADGPGLVSSRGSGGGWQSGSQAAKTSSRPQHLDHTWTTTLSTTLRAAQRCTSGGSSDPLSVTCGCRPAYSPTCEAMSCRFSSVRAVSQRHVPWMCPSKLATGAATGQRSRLTSPSRSARRPLMIPCLQSTPGLSDAVADLGISALVDPSQTGSVGCRCGQDWWSVSTSTGWECSFVRGTGLLLPKPSRRPGCQRSGMPGQEQNVRQCAPVFTLGDGGCYSLSYSPLCLPGGLTSAGAATHCCWRHRPVPVLPLWDRKSMSLELVVVGAACAAAGSLVTGYVLNLVEHRREARTAGAIEVSRKYHIDRYDAANRLVGLGAELLHKASNVSRGQEAGRDEAQSRVDEMRTFARSNSAVLDEQLLTAIMAYTDAVRRVVNDYSNSRGTDKMYELWNEFLKVNNATLRRPPI